MGIEEKYEIIIKSICEVIGIEKNDIVSILKDNNCKYLLFLTMKKYKCNYTDEVKKKLNINSQRIISVNLKKAKEKFLINREFREVYFQISDLVENNIKNNGRKIS
ncbi:ribose-5-phosphate isomerase [Haloimpatiens massiliensis]|uniref:ribose-5-phosphate isomerase n=1 Tax=Haloimpatiens massiliensis TaxID=1658110 RepID=UPI000C843786|nr:ribose-5-phosphate isomerase [Haloimpatiens massiliensis]